MGPTIFPPEVIFQSATEKTNIHFRAHIPVMEKGPTSAAGQIGVRPPGLTYSPAHDEAPSSREGSRRNGQQRNDKRQLRPRPHHEPHSFLLVPPV
jgi:hypothetical protein